jgi:3-oxoacyl-[acyl-carrier-protein] synthase-3
MNLSTINGVRMEAIAAVVPSNTIDNRSFAKEHFAEDLTSTITTLGIEHRHVCVNPQTTALDMCVSAAEKIFLSGAISREDIGAIIFVTQTPDMLTPNNASFAQHRLGLATDVFSFDMIHACAGYVCGLWNAALMAKNLGKKVLLLDGDTNSRYVSEYDKGTALLFGDAGTATVISPDNNAADWTFAFATDGSQAETTYVHVGYKYPLNTLSHELKDCENGSKRADTDMFMDGASIFAHAYKNVPRIATELMDELETTEEDYDRLIAHQANALLVKKIGKKLGFPISKTALITEDFGNSSSSCIPLIITIEKDLGTEHPLIFAIGAGITIGVGDISINGVNNLGLFMEEF